MTHPERPLSGETERAGAMLHSRRGPLHRFVWWSETSRHLPCSECVVTAGEVLDDFLERRERAAKT